MDRVGMGDAGDGGGIGGLGHDGCRGGNDGGGVDSPRAFIPLTTAAGCWKTLAAGVMP